MYIWKLIYWVLGIVIVVGTLIMSMNVSQSLTDSLLLHLIMAGTMGLGIIYVLLKPLIMLDKYIEAKVLLDKEARISFFVFVTFVIISLAVFLTSIFFFNEWLELINDTVNRTTEDHLTIIFPLVLLFASIGSLIGSLNLYKKYKETIKEENE